MLEFEEVAKTLLYKKGRKGENGKGQLWFVKPEYLLGNGEYRMELMENNTNNGIGHHQLIGHVVNQVFTMPQPRIPDNAPPAKKYSDIPKLPNQKDKMKGLLVYSSDIVLSYN